MRCRPAVFLDRDGVINFDSRDYVKMWDEFVFRPGSLKAIARLTQSACEIYVMTNQSGIARGLMSWPPLLDIHAKMQIEVARAGGRIMGIQVCPHRPEDDCLCRKPKPGMFLKAAAKWGLDLERSWFVGDFARDIQAGHTAGCTTIWVTTHATDELLQHQEEQMAVPPDFQAQHLAEAVQIILSRACLVAGPREAGLGAVDLTSTRDVPTIG